jgi:hypothetical protein
MVYKGGDEMLNHKCFLLNLMFTYGLIPQHFNTSLILPIIKDKANKKFDSNNYRPLSISNFVAQLFESIILDSNSNLKNSNPNQFGFKHGLSTLHPLFIVKETIDYSTAHKTPLYVASLDAEKAFDAIWRDGLFCKLIDKLDFNCWHLLKNYYNNSKGTMKINDIIYSDSIFTIERGVKQGGIISPYLFNIFINDLIEKINNNDSKTLFGSANISCLAYADDILLMSYSLNHMKNMLNVCDEYSKIWKIKFNPNKSTLLLSGKPIYNCNQINCYLNNQQLGIVNEFEYLGLMINQKNKFEKFRIDKMLKAQRCFFGLNKYDTSWSFSCN